VLDVREHGGKIKRKKRNQERKEGVSLQSNEGVITVKAGGARVKTRVKKAAQQRRRRMPSHE